MTRFLIRLILLFLLPASALATETNTVVVTIKPLHSLVQGVMGTTGKATLLISGTASPHGFSLKPSQVRDLQDAAVVFYIDGSFESFLKNALAALPDGVRKVSLSHATGVEILERREGGAWDDADHGHEHGHSHASGDADDHGTEADNMHLWLDPGNAIMITRAIATELGRLYPENKPVYIDNAEKQISRINALDAELRVRLASLTGRPFIVLHDAYPYFERHYNVLAVGSLTLEPDAPASAKRLKDIRAKIQDSGATCIFREPQFDDRLLRTAAEGLPVKLGILDPIGAELEPGADLYFDLMEALATGLRDCLTAQS